MSQVLTHDIFWSHFGCARILSTSLAFAVEQQTGVEGHGKIRYFLSENDETLEDVEGAFSSLSRPIFATKYSLFQHSSRSSRSTHLCTAPDSKCLQTFVKLFSHVFLFESLEKSCSASSARRQFFLQFSSNFIFILMKILQNFS